MPTLTTRQQQLSYEVVGDGAPILLLHSFLCSSEMWRPQIEDLAQTYKVISLDLRGHGKSSPSLPHSLYDLVEDAVAVLDQEAVDEAVWCGLSIGGMISMRAALVYPERVRGLVLLDTDGRREAKWTQFENRLLSYIARVVGVKPVVSRVLTKMFCDTTLKTKTELVAHWSNHFSEFHVPSAIKTLHALNNRDDVLEYLRELNCPTLVIHGAEDRALPPVCGARLSTAIRGSNYQVVEGAGHLPTLEQPEVVNTHMRRFLESVV